MNVFFASTFTKENCEVVPTIPLATYQEPLNKIPVDNEEVKKLLKELNPYKSAGPDDLHPRVIKEAAPVLAAPLTYIFEESLKTGELPEDWRAANITPIHKKGSRRMSQNYRPVSLTSICCKVLEKLIRSRVNNHMTQNNLYSKHQHGFMTGRSTVTQLLEYLDFVTNSIDNDLPVDVIMLDFMKAFDSVPHERLISKLSSYGIDGKLRTWLRTFLTKRKQRTIVDGNASTWRNMISGIPQGSVMGPVLFAIFINDMPQLATTNIKHFADDTKLYGNAKTLEQCQTIQEDLRKLEEWENKWQLRFHLNKCTVVRINKGHPEFIYKMRTDDSQVELAVSDTERDLGVLIDKNLNFENHIHQITKKANSMIGMIWRSFDFLDIHTFQLLYKAIIRPKLEYATPVWTPNSWRLVEEVEKIQRRATKMLPQ